MDYILPDASLEQQQVIKEIEINNLVVDSVAGSGKTTCILHLAEKYASSKILLLTYNARLKLETRQKIKKLCIKNLETHSYHSFCVKYYNETCYNDSNIHNMLINNNATYNTFDYDIIILDEVQDITPLYYEVFCKIYNNNIKESKVCIFGDRWQSIFGYNNADERFITKAYNIFNLNNFPWKTLSLSTSFRITHEMALFINKCMIGYDRISSNKKVNRKPRYIITDCWEKGRNTLKELEYYFNLGYKPNDIFILAPSVRGKGPISYLENCLKMNMPNISIYIPLSDDEKLDSDLMEGKLVFSTFHQTKGLERKVIIIFNFDYSYFQFFNKTANPDICSNPLYVAVTRASEHLSVFHNYSSNFFPFLNTNNLYKYCDIIEDKPLSLEVSMVSNNNKNKNEISVTELLRHLPWQVLDECFDLIDVETLIIPKQKLDIKANVRQGNKYESVSELTGLAIPMFFEIYKIGYMPVLEYLRECNFEEKIKMKLGNKFKKYDLDDINIFNISPEELLYLANCWNTHKSEYLFKIHQIKEYNWLSESSLYEGLERLKSLNISDNSVFEDLLTLRGKPELLGKTLKGYIDCLDIDNKYLFEFKCVNELTKEHQIQSILYKYLFEQKNKFKITVYLFNISNGELQKINTNNATEIVNILMKHKYTVKGPELDSIFNDRIQKIKNSYTQF